MPVTTDAFQPVNRNDGAFLAQLSGDGSSLNYASYLGGTATEAALAIAIDPLGDVYVAGYTYSNDFPTTPGAFQTRPGGGDDDAFVAKFQLGAPASSFSVTRAGPNEGGNAGTVTPSVFGFGFLPGATAALICSSGTIQGTNVTLGQNGSSLT